MPESNRTGLLHREGKPRAESNSEGSGVVALQARAQNKKSRASLMPVTSSAVSPMIPRQVLRDEAGLKSNHEVKSVQGLNQQSTRASTGIAAV